MSASASLQVERRGAASALKLGGIGACVLLLLPFALAMSWPRLAVVWQTGTFFDTDDAMRMVEVRDWLAGQGWFDLAAHRLEPPAGLAMHWSRVVDVPVGALVLLFRLVTDPVHAERLARLVFPLALQAAMIGATAFTARILVGPRAVMPAAFLVLLSGISYGQFQPGRIDHHAPQILLLMLATGTTLRALDPARGRQAAASAVAIALSLSISLENLPFFAVLLAVPGLAWAIRGAPGRPALGAFALGLGTALPVLFLATVPPDRYAIGACDAFSVAHLTGLMAGAAMLGFLALIAPRLPTPIARWGALAVAGLIVGGLVLATFPACLHDPYAAMDPLIARLWLHHVTEAQPLALAVARHPDTLTILVCPILAGAVASVIAARRTAGLTRARWSVVAALVGMGLAGAAWQLRVTSSVGPLALLAGVWAVVEALDLAQRRQRAVFAVLPFGAACLFSTLAWALVPVPDAWDGSAPADRSGSARCRQAEAFQTLAGLPPTLVFAPIDAGAHLLAHTPVGVLAAPYHRDQAGNRLVLQGLTAAPEEAKAIVEGSGAKILTFCRDDSQMKMIAKETPGSLAARLIAGDIPPWLDAMAPADPLYPTYRIR